MNREIEVGGAKHFLYTRKWGLRKCIACYFEKSKTLIALKLQEVRPAIPALRGAEAGGF